MAGIRGPGRRGKDRSRATAAGLISATVVLAVLVAVGVVAFLHSRSADAAQPGQLGLSNKITSQQSVGLANLGRTGQAAHSGQQWQAEEMGGGGSVLLFSPDGRCLTAVGGGAQATVQLMPCDTGLDQRWYHPFQGTDAEGRDYWPLRSASDGRCLALGTASSGGSVVAELQKCTAGKTWPQLIMFWSAY